MEIRHDPARKMFELLDPEGHRIGELTYHLAGERVVIDHTGVRDEYGGQGLARRLVEAAAAWLRATGQRAVPVCSYAARVMGDPKFADVVGRRGGA